jgi:vacuolar-type H+-ATPase subunit D/Vma8
MPSKYKLTRPELKRYRDALGRFEHYLPMLKLKQQQLQVRLRQIAQDRATIEQIGRASCRERV